MYARYGQSMARWLGAALVWGVGILPAQVSFVGPQRDFGVGLNPQAVALADFNQDGKLDVAAANRGSRNISVLLGNGDATFQPRADFGPVGDPLSLVAGDFDRDGNPDLAAPNYLSNNVSVLRGRGDGTFRTP